MEEFEDEAGTVLVGFTVRNARPVAGKSLFALADVEMRVAGVIFAILGVQARRFPDGGSTVSLPTVKDADGSWPPAIELPEELRAARCCRAGLPGRARPGTAQALSRLRLRLSRMQGNGPSLAGDRERSKTAKTSPQHFALYSRWTATRSQESPDKVRASEPSPDVFAVCLERLGCTGG